MAKPQGSTWEAIVGAGNLCSILESEITYCQTQKVKVFLSLGIDRTLSTTNSNLTASPDAAENLANYLLENFLSGKSGPLGNVSLDGIDFPAVSDGENLHWDEVVTAINASTTARKIYLSAAPICFFYQNPCIYTPGNPSNLFNEWNIWTKNVPNSLIFLGVVATKEIAGYIDYFELIDDVLPIVRQSSNYDMMFKDSVDVCVKVMTALHRMGYTVCVQDLSLYQSDASMNDPLVPVRCSLS
ncbi:unnamed protein product [Sphenostylis stenocarpa]|uniref:GH18 domain-containing protein n=1 Tax=Sphenostylis stenocarpa TaxID=92480 RepID=A0AA86SKH6_9FABA|nr:unnamed protein product [Sphenostylis stenocarpa]